MVPITGAGGIEERGFITATADEGEVHPVELVTVKV
jgi:hypothetical protein